MPLLRFSRRHLGTGLRSPERKQNPARRGKAEIFLSLRVLGHPGQLMVLKNMGLQEPVSPQPRETLTPMPFLGRVLLPRLWADGLLQAHVLWS